ncbi:MAG: putative metal-binding motif-containing protein [Myxococcota bacterium]
MVSFLLVLSAFAQDTCLPGADCDGDGFTSAQGDCDDTNPDVKPGRQEDCGNTLDDNCDGLYNEGCDRSVEQGQLRGGSTCESQAPNGAWLFLPMLLWRRRRS